MRAAVFVFVCLFCLLDLGEALQFWIESQGGLVDVAHADTQGAAFHAEGTASAEALRRRQVVPSEAHRGCLRT